MNQINQIDFDTDFSGSPGFLFWADFGLKATFLLAVGLLACLAAARASAGLRSYIVLLTIAGLPLLLALAPLSRWEFTRQLRDIEMLSSWPQETPFVLNVVPAQSTIASPAAGSVRTSLDVPKLLLGMWLAGSCIAAVGVVSGGLRRHRQRRILRVQSAVTLPVLEELRSAFGIQRSIRLVYGPAKSMPGTWGIWRPAILLPQDARAWPDSLLHQVLRHELAHIRRWDALGNWIIRIPICLLWFHPLVWLAKRLWLRLREQACDDFVLTGPEEGVAYGENLLTIVKQRLETPLVTGMSTPVANMDFVRLGTQLEFLAQPVGGTRMVHQVSLKISEISGPPKVKGHKPEIAEQVLERKFTTEKNTGFFTLGGLKGKEGKELLTTIAMSREVNP